MAITFDKVSDGLPISVIVPLSKKRNDFFNNFVLPLIEANNPAEIIVNDNEGTAPKKRNDGFKMATQPYLFFCDDDIILPANYLESLLNVLEKNSDKGYSYTGYHGIVLYPDSHPMRGNFQIPSRPFSGNALRQGNYISTMSLMRKEVFPGFDENLKRLQDWDIFLTMLNRGIEGVFVPNLKFFPYYLDEGITSNTNNEVDAITAIIKKHNIGIS
jgi:glycosyltransferase involved in cell wall biosynthesis